MSTPSKTVRVNRAAFNALMIAGQKMSNLCFNLSQMPDNKHAKEMREGYREWDAAQNKLKGGLGGKP